MWQSPPTDDNTRKLFDRSLFASLSTHARGERACGVVDRVPVNHVELCGGGGGGGVRLGVSVMR